MHRSACGNVEILRLRVGRPAGAGRRQKRADSSLRMTRFLFVNFVAAVKWRFFLTEKVRNGDFKFENFRFQMKGKTEQSRK